MKYKLARVLIIFSLVGFSISSVPQITPASAAGGPGAFDTTFSSTGISLGLIGAAAQFTSIKIDSSGRILAGGSATLGGQQKSILARFQPNGSLDTSFGTNGYTVFSLGTNDEILSIAIDSLGRIVTGGISVIGGSEVFVLARFTANGSLDTSFGVNGSNTSTPGTDDLITSVQIDATGEIFAAGDANFGGSPRGVVAKYTASGILDTSFGTGGYSASPAGVDYQFSSLVLENSGDVVAGGYSYTTGHRAFTLTRLLPNGNIDTSFATNGYDYTTPGTRDGISSLALDSLGNIVAAGYATLAGNVHLTVARYLSSGLLDTSFGTGGFNTTTVGSGDYFNSVAIDSSGKIISAGSANIAGQTTFAVARYNSDGSIDSTFGTNGVSTLTPGSNDYFWSLAIDSSGRILAGGTATVGGVGDYALVRYLSTNAQPVQATYPLQQSKITGISPESAISYGKLCGTSKKYLCK